MHKSALICARAATCTTERRHRLTLAEKFAGGAWHLAPGTWRPLVGTGVAPVPRRPSWIRTPRFPVLSPVARLSSRRRPPFQLVGAGPSGAGQGRARVRPSAAAAASAGVTLQSVSLHGTWQRNDPNINLYWALIADNRR